MKIFYNADIFVDVTGSCITMYKNITVKIEFMQELKSFSQYLIFHFLIDVVSSPVLGEFKYNPILKAYEVYTPCGFTVVRL
ncbi:hypothetical protein AKJ55_01400 [candidate division MSBL1 archaeon SCGC-AAA382M17]|uniref:Uncharacterized protein n=1 Tax=candidate division MSBL1 archaeon SCGC-AAA382M17 TaxID=1698284 RepID=A0ABR5TJE2_9EURY|nr:hypothetical protein AKJ55_01400 [candidate division MSBL1 archaeon SCGC-AAA382M17]